MVEQTLQQKKERLLENGSQELDLPDTGLGKRFNELEKYVNEQAKELKEEAKDARQIVFFGFIILLVTVALFLIQNGYQLITSYNSLRDEMIKLEMKLP